MMYDLKNLEYLYNLRGFLRLFFKIYLRYGLKIWVLSRFFSIIERWKIKSRVGKFKVLKERGVSEINVSYEQGVLS